MKTFFEQQVNKMAEELNILIYEVVGSPLAVAADDGQKVFERVATAIKEDKAVSVSFRNLESVTSAFLNAAIGQLYSQFDDKQVRAHLKITDAAPDDLSLLNRVVKTAKDYFNDPSKFDRAARRTFGDKADEK